MKLEKSQRGNLIIKAADGSFLYLIGATPLISADLMDKDRLVFDHLTTTREAQHISIDVSKVSSVLGQPFSGDRNALMTILSENFAF